MARIRNTAALLVFGLAPGFWSGCSSSGGGGSQAEGETEVEVLGVDPELFECDSVAPVEAIESALGGTVETADAQFTAPFGAPKPCNYLRRFGETVEPWSFDLDCRPQALADAKSLIAGYRKSKNTDAGSAEVSVGRGGLDHHGHSLIFIDDDTPCYVRVHGPNASGRLSLAEAIATRLTEQSAPMRAVYRAR